MKDRRGLLEMGPAIAEAKCISVSRTRKQPDDAQIAAGLRAFRENSAPAVLARIAAALRANTPLNKTEREYIANLLDILHRWALLDFQSMGDVKRRAVIADYLRLTKKITLRAAAQAVAGKHRLGTVLRAVPRLEHDRRKRSKRK